MIPYQTVCPCQEPMIKTVNYKCLDEGRNFDLLAPTLLMASQQSIVVSDFPVIHLHFRSFTYSAIICYCHLLSEICQVWHFRMMILQYLSHFIQKCINFSGLENKSLSSWMLDSWNRSLDMEAEKNDLYLGWPWPNNVH